MPASSSKTAEPWLGRVDQVDNNGYPIVTGTETQIFVVEYHAIYWGLYICHMHHMPYMDLAYGIQHLHFRYLKSSENCGFVCQDVEKSLVKQNAHIHILEAIH